MVSGIPNIKKRSAHANPRTVTDVDAVIGHNLKIMRTARGLSQESLAEALGLTFQQIQKYENGTNRMSASRLYGTALVLKVDFSDFFNDLPRPTNRAHPSFANDFLTPQNIELLTLIHKITTPEKKAIAKSLLRTLAIP